MVIQLKKRAVETTGAARTYKGHKKWLQFILGKAVEAYFKENNLELSVRPNIIKDSGEVVSTVCFTIAPVVQKSPRDVAYRVAQLANYYQCRYPEKASKKLLQNY